MARIRCFQPIFILAGHPASWVAGRKNANGSAISYWRAVDLALTLLPIRLVIIAGDL